MRLNKKLFCFLFVMFITLICCCAVSAVDDSDMETIATATATTSNDVVKDVESISNVHSNEVTGSTDDTLESDNNNEEAVNQNGVLDENNNLNKVEKTKVSNRAVKTAASYTGEDFLGLAQNGVINLDDDVIITSTVILNRNLTINGNGYTITSQGAHDLFLSPYGSDNQAPGLYSLTMNDTKVTGVQEGYYVIKQGANHKIFSCDFYNNAGIYTEPRKVHKLLAMTMVNCHFTGCKANAFLVDTTGTQNREFIVVNCVFEDNQNPIFALFQHSIFDGYNFIIDDELVYYDGVDNEFVGAQGTNKPIEKQQQISINIFALQINPNIVIDCEDKVYVDEVNDINVTLTVVIPYKDQYGNSHTITAGAPNENVTLEVKYADGRSTILTGTIGDDGTVLNLTDYAGRTFNQVIGNETGVVNVSAIFNGSRFKVKYGDAYVPLYNATNASRTYQIIQIPTTTVTTDVTGKVGVATTLTATVKNDSVTGNTDNVPQGTVTFIIDEDVVGTAPVIDGVATLEGAIFSHAVSSGSITAEFHDENDKYADSSDTANIKIQPGVANISAVAVPDRGVPGVDSLVNITVWDNNTGLYINGTVTIDGTTVEIKDGKGNYTYPITVDTSLDGTTLTAVFSSPDYESVSADVTVYRLLIPTTTVVDPVDSTVFTPVEITANVTNNSGNVAVNQGKVNFTFNGESIGVADVKDGQAKITVKFNETYVDAIIYAKYVDDNTGDAKIFDDSEGSNENTGKTNIGKRVAEITATPKPASGIPGVTSTVTITVNDVKDSSIKINGTVTINDLNDTSKTFNPIEISEGEGIFDYSIIDTTLLTGNTLNFTFKDKKGNYDDVDTTATIARLLIPTATVVNPVTGIVGVSTPVTAKVTTIDADGRIVDNGTVTFTYNDTVIGTATISNGEAMIYVVFNHTIDNGIITATYVDVREGEAKIFDGSEGSNEKTGKTNIAKGVANISAVAVPDRGVPGVDSLVNITVWDNNTGLYINGTVTIDGTTVEIKDGKGNYTYPITVDTSLDGTTLTAVFSSPDYESVSDDVTIKRELIPTTTVVDSVDSTVFTPVEITANVTNNSGNVAVNQGKVNFTFNGESIGVADVKDGQAKITVKFNETYVDAIIYAKYVDDNTGDAKIFDDSEGSNENTGKTNIGKREARIIAVAVPEHDIPGNVSNVTVTVIDVDDSSILPNGTINVTDLNTSINLGTFNIVNGNGNFSYDIINSTFRSGNVLNITFTSKEYDDLNTAVTIGRDLIPTTTVVSPVNGMVGVSTPVIANVTSSNGYVVDAGNVTFTYNGEVIGIATISNGKATIDVIFNHTIDNGIITATYVDVREGEAKIFEDSEGSNENTGKTNIDKGEANITAEPDSRDIPGVNITVTIKVKDNNTESPIDGTVTIDGTTVEIKDGEGTYNYPITDDTSRDGTTLTAVFSSPDYNEVSDTVTIARDLIPTTTVVSPVNGMVGVSTPVIANVTSSNGRVVDAGNVTFTYNGEVIGIATISNGKATIDVIFNHTIDNGIITASYVDVREGEAKIFNDSEGSNEITGKTNIEKGVANISAVAVPIHDIPGKTSVVNITVWDNNTGLPISGSVTIDGTSVTIGEDGKGSYDYLITDDTSRDGTTLTAVFSSPDYNEVSDTVTIARDLIPTTTVVDPVTGTVGVPTTVTAVVTSSNGRTITQGKVTFTFDGKVIGTAIVNDGVATISVVFNNSVTDGLTTADYVDDNVGEAKIFDISSSSTDIDESGRTNIVPGEAVIVAVANPDSGIPGVTSVVDITVTDKNTGLPINGTVTIDGTTVDIINGEGSYDYLITDDTSRDGTTLTAVFSSPDYNEVSDTVTISRDLIPTTTVVSPVNGMVGVSTPVIANVTSSNGRVVDAGNVTFTYNGEVIGIATISNGKATIDVIFNHTIDNGIITATYVDVREGEAKIFDGSEGSNENTGKTNIVKGEAVIVAVPVPDRDIPGVTSVVTITVTDKNTGLPIDGDVTIDGTTVPVARGTAIYDYGIVDSTLRAGTVLTAEFSSPDYESVSADVTVYRLLIPTAIVVEPVNGVVGIPTTITAVVTSSNGRPVTQGIVTFAYNGQVIGVADVTITGDESVSDVKMASPGDATASISVVFNNSITDGLITADYVDDNVGEAKIFDDSSSSTDIDESGRTNIVPGEAVIVAVADPDSGIPGVISVVDITVTDKNTGLPINGTVTIDGTTVDIIDGEGSYDYLISDDTSRDGSVLTAVFSSPDYESVSDDVTISRELIPTTTVVSPVTGSVGSPVTVTATVTSSNGRTVTQGKITFTFDGKVIGTATVSNGIASISVVFNNSITDGLTTADYVDDNVGDAKIFDISTSSTDIDESGRTNIVPGQASIDATPIPASGIPGVISVVDITVTDANTGLPINGIVSIDGTNVTIVDGKGTYNYPITVDTSRDGTVLTAEFSSPDYESVSDDVVISRELIPTNTNATVINNTVNNVIIKVNVTDEINNEPVPNGTVEVYVNDTLVGKGEIVDGVVDIVTGITEVGTYDITVKYTGNDVYTDSEDVLEDVEVVSLEPRIIKIGFWKLVCFNVTPEKNTTNYTKPSKVIKPAIRYKAHRTTKFTGSSKYYRAVNNYRHYKPSWKKSSSRPIIIPPMSKLQYRLFIVLYADVMEGDMSFADFVAILKLNGIEIATLNSWNENGEIIIDYDNLEEVPDSIEIVDNGGHLEDYSQSINKNNAPDNEGVIDSGDVEVKSKASNAESSNAPSTSGSHASSSNAGFSGDSGVAAADGE